MKQLAFMCVDFYELLNFLLLDRRNVGILDGATNSPSGDGESSSV